MTVKDKIRVFISSRCSEKDTKLLIIRQSLKLALEETGIFEIFIYEDDYATYEENEQYYLSELNKSDLCLFVIDEIEHKSESGVFKEHLYAKNHNIKTLYIFVKGSEKNPNKSVFEVSIRYAEKPYEKIVCEGYSAVIKSVVTQFKGTKSIIREETEVSRCDKDLKYSVEIEEKICPNASIVAFIPPKKVLASLEETSQILFNSFQGTLNDPLHKRESMDYYTSLFIDKILNVSINGDFNIGEIEEYIISSHPKNEQLIIKKRFQAIEEIYEKGNYEEAQKILGQLYDKNYNNSNIPQWLVYDILIDLRNLSIINGKLEPSNKWQRIINELSEPIHYPVIDRSGWNFYEEIEKETFNESLKNYSEMRYSSWGNKYGKNLAEYAAMALYNGSYVHIEQIKVHLLYLSWNAFQEFPEATNYLLQSLKFCILSNNNERFQKIMKKYRFILSTLESSDVESLFIIGDCFRNDYISRKWFLILHAQIGIYVEEDIFQLHLIRLNEEYIQINLKDPQEVKLFLKCLINNSARISNTSMVSFMCDLLPKIHSWDLIKESFSYISQYNFEKLLSEDFQKITLLIYEKIEIMKDYSTYIDPTMLLTKIAKDKRSNKDLFNKKLQLVDLKTQEFVQWNLKLEEDRNVEKFITEAIRIEKSRNDEYGKNNSWPGYTYFPLIVVESLIKKKEKIPAPLIKELSDTINMILENPNQPYNEKTSALDLLYWLKGRYINEMKHFLISETIFSASKSYRLMESETQVLEYEIKLFLLHACVLGDKSQIENYLAENTLSSGYAKEAIARAFILAVDALSVKKIPMDIYAIMINFFSFSINGTTPDFPVLATIFCLKCIPYANAESIILKLLLQLCRNGDFRVRYRILESFEDINKIDKRLANSILTLSRTDSHHEVKKLILGLEQVG